MRLFRTLLALVIALSVGMAPAAAAFAATSTGAGTSLPSTRIETTVLAHDHHAQNPGHHHGTSRDTAASDDCCVSDVGAPAQSIPGDCSSMPGCILKCLGTAAFAPMDILIPMTGSSRVSWEVIQAVPPDPPTRPFHPPRS